MAEILRENEPLHARILELEQERDGLHKDIEELCIQKGGSSFISLATKTYLQRTAGLEQEVENLKKKLADCAKENSDINCELSEANTIKTHLDQLHKLEVSKNVETAKQLEYLHRAVATAFSDRDRALMEAEKAKENEELMRQQLKEAEMRIQDLSVRPVETEQLILNLRMKLEKQKQDIEDFKKVIDKFYKIRQQSSRGSEDDEDSRVDDEIENVSWDDKCACLYNDATESWSFSVHQESSSANYVAVLLDEVEMLRGSVDDLQTKLQMGWEIEKRLNRKISSMEQEKIVSDRHIVDGISSLRDCYNQQKRHIMELLDDERSYQQSIIRSINQKIEKLHREIQAAEATSSSIPTFAQVADFSDTLAQALQEKVSALILSSNQEERHIWEKNVHAAVQETVDELQGYLKLASEEKVKALLELAEVKQQYQQLFEKTNQENTQGNRVPNSGERTASLERGSITNLFKSTSLRRWLSTEQNIPPVELEGCSSSQRSNHSKDNARLRIENATLKDSIHSLERLTSDISKLRLSLIQAKMARSFKNPSSSTPRQLDETIKEAESLKISLNNALPLSWSVEGEVSPSSYVIVNENPMHEVDKIDTVTAAGLEMVELLVMAAQMLKEKKSKREPRMK